MMVTIDKKQNADRNTPKKKKYPDGKSLTQYGRYKTWSYRRWAWEFLCRNTKFRQACDRVAEASELSKSKVAEEFGLATFKHYADVQTKSNVFPVFKDGAIRTIPNISSEKLEKSVCILPGQVLIRFKLKTEVNTIAAIEAQLERARLRLYKLHAEYNQIGGVHAAEINQKIATDSMSLVNYLRILDLKAKAVQKDCKKGVLWPDASATQMQRRLTQLEELLKQQNIQTVITFLSVVRASRKKVSESVTGQFDKLAGYVKVLCAIRNKYSAIKKAKGSIDYSDMLVQAVKAIEGGASVPFTHILVDEYQDCSAAQTHLLAQLAKLDGRSLMVFGDSCQGIYGFAGANYTALTNVLDEVQQLSLPVSRRLTSQTAALASAVAQLEGSQAIQATRDGEEPALVCDDTLGSQTTHIVRDIQKLIEAGAPPEQIAVLARTKALLHPVEQSLLALDMQTSRMGVRRHRKHVLAVLGLVRIVERSAVSKSKVKPEKLRKALPNVTAEDARWKKETPNLAKVGRMPSLESRYKGCAAVYLRMHGGVYGQNRHQPNQAWLLPEMTFLSL